MGQDIPQAITSKQHVVAVHVDGTDEARQTPGADGGPERARIRIRMMLTLLAWLIGNEESAMATFLVAPQAKLGSKSRYRILSE